MLPVLILLALVVLFTGAAPAGATPGVPSQVIIGPLMPDLQTLAPFNIYIVHNPVRGIKLLRFANSIANTGRGPMELLGESDSASGRTYVTQRLLWSEGRRQNRKAGSYIFHKEHDHWHFENFARYELWAVDPDGQFQLQVAVSDKVSYCLRDNTRLTDTEGSNRPVYQDCSAQLQGISAGWVDTYEAERAGQYLDITGLSDGLYALRSTVDPANMLAESNDLNNAAQVYLRIAENRAVVVSLPGGLARYPFFNR